MHLERPEAFLLLPLAVLLLRRRLWPRPLVGSLRALLLVLLAAMLAGPSFGEVADGRDVVLVVDRSRSMPDGSEVAAREFAQQIAAAMADGDRIGVVAFGRDAVVLAAPHEELRWPDAATTVDADGSDLAAGLVAALGTIAPGRPATLVVWSDGEHTDGDADAVALLASRRAVRIDVVPAARSLGRDAAVDEVGAPAEVPIEAPFAVRANVVATAGGDAAWRLFVDGAVLREGRATLVAGRNVLELQHRVTEPGEHLLALEVRLAGDVVPQNDRGQAVVRGVARSRVLCVTPGGREDRLTAALRSAGIEVVVAAPDVAPLTLAALDGFRSVVLEDVPASALPPGGMRALATWVEDLGGGLLMTGGRNGFGVGGYHRSPVEQVLPVTMEIREQQRRFGLALAIALDRSGSMRAEVAGVTKMELASRGAAAAIELLSGIDAVAVLAVDTAAHVVQARVAVDDARELAERARRIESSGGGIYVGAALHGAAEQLEGATQAAKHIVLFADAADAEEPDDYATFVPQLVADGVTVSVIGLGSDSDPDARLLEEIAQLGNGRCQFVADATELPRVFAQETIEVARSSLVETPAEVATTPALALLGAMPATLPPVGGYSIAWLRPEAERCASPVGDDEVPLVASWQCGLGRGAVFLGEADGALTGAWADWPGYGDFFATLVRWLGGGAAAGVYVDAFRDGDVGVYQLEVEPGRAAVLDAARGALTLPDGRSEPLSWVAVGPGRAEARVPLRSLGVHRAAVQVGGDTVRLPPLCRPYSAEWALQPDARAGERELRALARRAGGSVAPSVAQVLAGPRRSLGRRDLGPWCAGFALLLLVVEIAVRRLHVHLALPRRVRRSQSTSDATRTGATRSGATSGSGAHAGAQGVAGRDASPPAADDLIDALARAQRRGQRRV